MFSIHFIHYLEIDLLSLCIVPARILKVMGSQISNSLPNVDLTKLCYQSKSFKDVNKMKEITRDNYQETIIKRDNYKPAPAMSILESDSILPILSQPRTIVDNGWQKTACFKDIVGGIRWTSCAGTTQYFCMPPFFWYPKAVRIASEIQNWGCPRVQ